MTKQTLPFPVIDAAEVSLSTEATLLAAMEVLEKSSAKIVIAVDKTGKIVGSLTDGDIRRGLLKGETPHSSIEKVMHKNPYVLPVTTPRQRLLEIMREQDIRQVPLVTTKGEVAGVATYALLSGLSYPARPNTVVIMAGGKGKRLLPLTSDCPKPMVIIGGKPILEWILQRFIHYGFTEFILSINYLGHMIEEYFGDGRTFGCKISYVRETEPLGTAGALSLIETPPAHPLIVINGDILASVDFPTLLDSHVEQKSAATICARAHHTEVPYGVIQLKDGQLHTIVEKPVYEDLISAGIYALNPEILRQVPKNCATDMPNLLLSLVQNKQKVSVFSMQEEWLDIGRHDDLEKAKLALVDKAS